MSDRLPEPIKPSSSSIEQLPDILNFGKNSRRMLGANVMPLLNKALQQTMLNLPSNPTYHIAQFLRENNPSRGALPVELSLPAIFLSRRDEVALAAGTVRFDELESRLSSVSSLAGMKSLVKERLMALQSEKRSSNRKKQNEISGVVNAKEIESTVTSSGLTRRASVIVTPTPTTEQQSEEKKKPHKVRFTDEISQGNDDAVANDNSVTKHETVEDSIMVEHQQQNESSSPISRGAGDEQETAVEDCGVGGEEEEEDDDDSHFLDDEEEDFVHQTLAQQEHDRMISGDQSKEITLQLSGREKDGHAARIYQNGRQPVWSVELPVLDGLETVFSRINQLVCDYEVDQEPLQQHDMNNMRHCFFSDERRRQEEEDFNDGVTSSTATTTTSTSTSTNSNSGDKSKSTEQKRVKIHFVICGTVDIQCYIGGVCMRGVIGQETCNIIQAQQTIHHRHHQQSSEQQPSSSSSLLKIEDYESQCIKALQMGAKLRPNAFKEKYRQVLSIETAIKDAFAQFQQNEQDQFDHHHQSRIINNKIESSSSPSQPVSAAKFIKSESCQVHRLCEFHDASVSEQFIEGIHKISEVCAAERAQGICSVIAVCSLYKQSFVRNTCELFSAYFLQRSRALHLDRVGFAIANDENIRQLLAQTPLNLHESALERRKKRDAVRRKLIADQEKYLRVNGLKEDPEVERLLKDAVDARKTRRHKEDVVAIEMTNKCIRTAATRAQMCFKMHVAWQSLMQGRTAAIVSKDDVASDKDLEKYRIADPPLIRVITEHLREALGTETVASLEHTPRPKPAVVQKRRILLVRHTKLPKHTKLQDLDVSSEEEEWYDVEKERSSESNLDAARAVVSAPCRPWDDVATLCRWCGEDGILNECCQLAEEFVGQCSLENRILRNFERLAYLLFYDVYCFMLWRDRTAKNRRVHEKRTTTTTTTTATTPRHLDFIAGPTPTLSRSSLLNAANNSNGNKASMKNQHSLESIIASSSMTFTDFLETWCSKSLSMLNSSSWSVSASLGLYFQKPFASLSSPTLHPVTLPVSLTDVVTNNNQMNKKDNNSDLLKKTTSATTAENLAVLNNKNNNGKKPTGTSSLLQSKFGNANAVKRSSIVTAGSATSLTPSKQKKSSLHDQQNNQSEDSNNNNHNHQQSSKSTKLDPKLTSVEQPFPELPPGSFYFVSEAMPVRAIVETCKKIFNDSNSFALKQQKQQQQQQPVVVTGVCWVSTIADPLLYVEEDEVISLSARPAHATFDGLNDDDDVVELPASAFLGYSQGHRPNVKVISSSASSSTESKRFASSPDFPSASSAASQQQKQQQQQQSIITSSSSLTNSKQSSIVVKNQSMMLPDPFSQTFWKKQEEAFQEQVKNQLSKAKGSLVLFGFQGSSATAEANQNQHPQHQPLLGSSNKNNNKPSRGRCTMLFGPEAGGMFSTFSTAIVANTNNITATAVVGASSSFNTVRKLKLQHRNLLQHPASIPIIGAVKKEFRNTSNVVASNFKTSNSVVVANEEHEDDEKITLPVVRTASAVESLVQNRLSNSTMTTKSTLSHQQTFQFLRFPVWDCFGRVFLERLDEFRKTIERVPSDVALVFSLASPTSLFTSLIAMITRMNFKTSSNNNNNNDNDNEQASLLANHSLKNYVNLKELAQADALFLGTEVHIIFEMMLMTKNKKNASSPQAHSSKLYASLIEVLILLRRTNLLQSFVSAIDTNRQFAENAARAPMPSSPTSFKKPPGTTTTTTRTVNSSSADEFTNMSRVHQKRLVAWYAAQSAQKIERLCLLVFMQAFLSENHHSNTKSNVSASFYHFCCGGGDEGGESDERRVMAAIMKNHLMERIDPWQLPSSCLRNKQFFEMKKVNEVSDRRNVHESATVAAATTQTAVTSSASSSSFVVATGSSMVTSLERTMRDSTMMPVVPPLHAMSNATQKNKRWARELWLERAA